MSLRTNPGGNRKGCFALALPISIRQNVILVCEPMSNANAAEERPSYRYLVPLYADLRRLAGALLKRELTPGSLVATALTHEAVLRLLRLDRIAIHSSEHFLSLAAEEMRRVLVEYARRRLTLKRDGVRVELEERIVGDDRLAEVLEMENLMDALREADRRAYEVTRLHFYAGLNFAEIGEVLGVSAASAGREWRYAKAWLSERAGRHNG